MQLYFPNFAKSGNLPITLADKELNTLEYGDRQKLNTIENDK